MNKNLFRKVSLERLSSPEQLDRMMTVTSSKGWIALGVIICLLASVIVWGFFGVVTTRVEGQGILLKSGGVYNITHAYSGQIYDIKVVPGDFIKQGDVLAHINRDSIVEQISGLRERLTNNDNSNNVNEIRNEIKQLQLNLENESCVVSPYSGRVLEVKLNRGDMFSAGSPFISIELTGEGVKDLEGILYVSAQNGSKIIPGLEIYISPASVKKEDFGYMLGRVISVSEYPVTYQNMVKTLGNNELANVFSKSGPALEVHVDIVTANTLSGYEWTNSEGPPMKINSGTLFTGEVVISKDKPIKMILPIN